MSGTILIVDDVATNRILLKVMLTHACYDSLQADSGAEALRLARQHNPNLILLDLVLPGIDGVEVCQTLKADPATRDIPIIMMTAHSDSDARIRALEAGADEFMTKSHDEMILPARIRSLLRARETENELRLRDTTWRELGFAEPAAGFEPQGTLALVAGSRAMALDWQRRLKPFVGPDVLILDRQQALADPVAGSGAAVPDAYMVAADLHEAGDGLRLMSELRSRPGTRHAAICIMVPEGNSAAAVMALDLGANDLLTEGADPREIALRLTTQVRRKQQADRLRASMRDGMRAAVIDPLTGLYNRRYALPHVARIAERAGRTGRPFAVMVLDIDRFKTVNDTWGHAVGDAVLAEVATRLRDNLRPVDLIARIGGEEFLAVLPDTTLSQAKIAAERLRRVIEERAVAVAGGPQVSVTMSIGLALGGDGLDAGQDAGLDAGQNAGQNASPAPVQDLIDRADRALLSAKADGRNQVIISRTAA